MSYLLDTNIVSETVRRSPNKAVIAWLDQLPGEVLFVSVLTLGEIRKGIEALTGVTKWRRLMPVSTLFLNRKEFHNSAQGQQL